MKKINAFVFYPPKSRNLSKITEAYSMTNDFSFERVLRERVWGDCFRMRRLGNCSPGWRLMSGQATVKVPPMRAWVAVQAD